MTRLNQAAMPKIPGPEPAGDGLALDKARVVGVDDRGILVLTAAGVALVGLRAAGCLLEPVAGDTVLILRDPSETAFILNVLVREEPSGRLVLPGDAGIASESGTLRLTGESVEIKAREAAVVEAPRVDIKGVSGDVIFHSLTLVAEQARARLGRLASVARTIDTVAERMVQRLKDCYRRVDRMDETKAGHVSVRAAEFLNIKAGDASIVAENDVKIDGASIRLG